MMLVSDQDDESGGATIGSVLWAWMHRCMERTAVLSPKLLRETVAAKSRRIEVLATLTGKTVAAVRGLHLSDDVLGARTLEATLPLLAVFEAVSAKMPGTVPKDVTDVRGLFAAFEIDHLARHQSIALLSCVLSCTGDKAKEKLGGVEL